MHGSGVKYENPCNMVVDVTRERDICTKSGEGQLSK